MLEYFVILLVILSFTIQPARDDKYNSYKLLFSITLIFLFMALRVDYGGDYSSYQDYFKYLHSFNQFIPDNIEMGFSWLVFISPTYRVLLVVVAFILSSAIYVLFRNYIPVKYWALAFVILFINKSMLIGNMSGMRNSIAVSAFIYGFYFLVNGKKLSYIILMLAASFFHTSALFFLPAVLIKPTSLSKKSIQLIVLGIIAFAFISPLLSNLLNTITIKLVSLSYFSRYETYLMDEAASGYRGLSFIMIFFMLYMQIRFLQRKPLPKESLIAKLSLIYFVLLLAPSIGLSSRLFFFLSFPFMVTSMNLLSTEKSKLLKYAYTASLFVMFGLEFYGFSKTDRFFQLYLNYQSALY